MCWVLYFAVTIIWSDIELLGRFLLAYMFQACWVLGTGSVFGHVPSCVIIRQLTSDRPSQGALLRPAGCCSTWTALRVYMHGMPGEHALVSWIIWNAINSVTCIKDSGMRRDTQVWKMRFRNKWNESDLTLWVRNDTRTNSREKVALQFKTNV